MALKWILCALLLTYLLMFVTLTESRKKYTKSSVRQLNQMRRFFNLPKNLSTRKVLKYWGMYSKINPVNNPINAWRKRSSLEHLWNYLNAAYPSAIQDIAV